MEYSPDRMPVGKHDLDQRPFSEKEIKLETGDMVYAFTDGFQDQFGGSEGKKFKKNRLRQCVISIGHLPAPQQSVEIRKEFLKWKGELEQVDDITVIGVRV